MTLYGIIQKQGATGGWFMASPTLWDDQGACDREAARMQIERGPFVTIEVRTLLSEGAATDRMLNMLRSTWYDGELARNFPKIDGATLAIRTLTRGNLC